VTVHDAGTIINPMIVEGQIYGGALHGLGGALYEELAYDDDGQLLTGTFMDYLVPTASEAPEIDIEHVVSPSPLTTLGSKGAGRVVLDDRAGRHRQRGQRCAGAPRHQHHRAADDAITPARAHPGGPPGRPGVKPPRFEYHAPTTIDEAVALLARYGGEAKVLAGGQSLVPLLNFRLSRPAALIDVNRIAPLAYVREDNGTVTLGAMTRQRTIEFSAVVARRLPLLTEATRWVGHLPIRSRGTIGGSIAHADPASEYPAVLTALDGAVVAQSRAAAARSTPASCSRRT
jgi:hypothetical protein